MKTTIIELLNKIANGEEVPNKIKYSNIIYKATYRPNGDLFQYIDITNDEEYFNYYCVPLRLNDEVEILDEEDKIGKIDVAWQNVFDEQAQQDFAKMTLNKINELIDEVNKLKENK